MRKVRERSLSPSTLDPLNDDESTSRYNIKRLFRQSKRKNEKSNLATSSARADSRSSACKDKSKEENEETSNSSKVYRQRMDNTWNLKLL